MSDSQARGVEGRRAGAHSKSAQAHLHMKAHAVTDLTALELELVDEDVPSILGAQRGAVDEACTSKWGRLKPRGI